MPQPAPPSFSKMVSQGSLYPAGRIQAFFSAIAARYDVANHLLSFGCDILWRRWVARQVSRWQPRRILDLATGSGDLARELQRACPGAQVVGADFCAPMLAVAQQKGLAHLVVADGLRLPFPAHTFDVVTIAFGLRNMESWPRALAECARVLRPGGRLLVLDFSLPGGPFREVYRFYLHRILPRLAAVVTGQRGIYQYLADSIEEFPAGAAMREFLQANGFARTEHVPLQWGTVTAHIAEKSVE